MRAQRRAVGTAADAKQVACLLDSNQFSAGSCETSDAVTIIVGPPPRQLLCKRSLAYVTEPIYAGAECCRGLNKCCGARWSTVGRLAVDTWTAVRERRQELELTLDEASRAIGISRSHLNLIELGKATGVSGEAVARIDAGLGSQGALVVLLPPKDAADVTRSEEMRRAEFNKAVVALAAWLFFDPERLTGSQKADAALLRDYESLTRDFVRRQHHARPQTILGPTRAHLNQLLSLETTSLSPGMRQQLDRIIAETAALAGWVAFRSDGDLVTAHAQLALGRQHARRGRRRHPLGPAARRDQLPPLVAGPPSWRVVQPVRSCGAG
jgi:transcriptional regulator with XRE-family HTH domain